MRKVLFALLASILLATLVGCAQAPAPTSSPTPTATTKTSPPATTPVAKPIVLKFNHLYPPTGDPMEEAVFSGYAKRVEGLTGGRVKFEMYPLAQLLKIPDSLDGVSKGVADLGLVGAGWPAVAAKVPLSTVPTLPFLFKDMKEVINGTWSLFEKQDDIRSEWAQWNVVPLYIISGAFFNIWASKSVKALEDIKGLTLANAGGGAMTTAIEKLGGVPVNVASVETYETLQRHITDGVVNHSLAVTRDKLYEVINYGLIINVGTGVGPIVINKDTWNSLPEDIRKIMKDAGMEMNERIIKVLTEQDTISIEAIKQKGVQVSYATSEERARWVAKLTPIWDEWVKTNGAGAKRVLDTLQQTLAGMRK